MDEGLHEFSRILGVLTRCSKLKVKGAAVWVWLWASPHE